MRRHGAAATRLAWPVLGVLLVAGTRVLLPAAPPLYDGIAVPQAPYHYCNPPANLASSNQQPATGGGDLPVKDGVQQLGSPTTSDSQVLTFFAKGSLQVPPGATSIHVSIKPNCTPPAEPAGNRLVGNAYDIGVRAQPGDLPVTFLQPAQVLLRTPPVSYTSVQLLYDGTWHNTQWGQQQDTANVTINHEGTLATLDNGNPNPPGKPAQGSSFVGVIEAVLVAAALGVVVAAIIVQQRRARAAGSSPRRGAGPGGGAGTGRERPRGRRDRKRR